VLVKEQAAHLVVLPFIATGAHLALPREQITMHLVFSRTHIALSNSTRLAFARNGEQFCLTTLASNKNFLSINRENR
jgi:hypothetical protein